MNSTLAMVALVLLASGASAASSLKFASCSPFLGPTGVNLCANCSMTNSVVGTEGCFAFGNGNYPSAWSDRWNATAVGIQCVYPDGNGGVNDPRCVTMTTYNDDSCMNLNNLQTALCGTCHPRTTSTGQINYLFTHCSSSGSVVVQMTCLDQKCKDCDSSTMVTRLASQCAERVVTSQAYPCIEARVTLYQGTPGVATCDTQQAGVTAVSVRHSPNTQCMYGDFYAECRSDANWVPPPQAVTGTSLHLEVVHCSEKYCVEPINNTATCGASVSKQLPEGKCFKTASGTAYNPSAASNVDLDSRGSRSVITCPPNDDPKFVRSCVQVAFFQMEGKTPSCAPEDLYAQYTFVCDSRNIVRDVRYGDLRVLEVTCPDSNTVTINVYLVTDQTNVRGTMTFTSSTCSASSPELYVEGITPTDSVNRYAVYGATVMNVQSCYVYNNLTYQNVASCMEGAVNLYNPLAAVAFSGYLPQAMCQAGRVARCSYPDSSQTLPWEFMKYIQPMAKAASASAKYQLVAQKCALTPGSKGGFDTQLTDPKHAARFSDGTCIAPGTVTSDHSVTATCANFEEDGACATVSVFPYCEMAGAGLPGVRLELACDQCLKDPRFGHFRITCPESAMDRAPLVIETNCTETCDGCTGERKTIDNHHAQCQYIDVFGGHVTYFNRTYCNTILMNEWSGSACAGTPDIVRSVPSGQCLPNGIVLSCALIEVSWIRSYFDRYKTYLALFVITFLLLTAVILAYGRLYNKTLAQQEFYTAMADDGDDGAGVKPRTMRASSGFGGSSGFSRTSPGTSGDVPMTRVNVGSGGGVGSNTHSPAVSQQPVSIVQQEAYAQHTYAAQAAGRTLDDLSTISTHSA